MTLDKLENYLNDDFLIIGIGNDFKEFDTAGLKLIRKLKKIYPDKCIECGEVIENYLGKIIDKKVKNLIIVDTIYFDGDFKIFSPKEISLQGISTHSLSLRTISEYLKNWGINTIIFGLNPRLTSAKIQEIASKFEKLIIPS